MPDYIAQIDPDDRRENAQVDALLRQEGIRRDQNLDYTCGIFDEDGDLLATGSCFGNTIRCLAVSDRCQGQGLLNRILSHLLEIQAARGKTHLFLYTKPASAKYLSDLGFYEIARVPGKLVFMENRKDGFSRYCQALTQGPQAGKIAAIVMNANPFTLGHLHLVERAARENDAVHLFVLSEEAGPIPFAVRRHLVQEGTAHLSNVILQDSGPYIISSATFPSYFLRDEATVIRTQAALDLQVFGRIAGFLGIRRRYVGQENASATTALYNQVMKGRLPEMGMECVEIPRLEIAGRAVSASLVRQAIHDGHLDAVRDLLPACTYAYFSNDESLSVRAAIAGQADVIHH